MDVVYDGIRLTPEEIVERAKTGVHCVGLSILSGSHLAMTRDVLAQMKAAGLGHVPVVVGGIIPPEDAEQLRAEGVAAIYTPKDFAINGLSATSSDKWSATSCSNTGRSRHRSERRRSAANP